MQYTLMLELSRRQELTVETLPGRVGEEHLAQHQLMNGSGIPFTWAFTLILTYEGFGISP